jgi:hypothetical protein
MPSWLAVRAERPISMAAVRLIGAGGKWGSEAVEEV